MKKTYIKPTSYTQLKKHEMHEAKDAAIKFAGISRNEWEELMFETGCRFVEANAPLDLNLLTDIDFGFWEWWYYIFIKDDKNIVNSEKQNLIDDYTSFKECIIKDEYYITLFAFHFFNI
jgi:hypothetical protein